MAKIKTVTGGKVQSFIGSIKLLSESKGLLQKVEVRLLNSLVNRNNWQYLNLKEHLKLFANTPLLIAYKGKQIGDGHNYDEVYSPDGSVYASFMSATSERIVGWFKSEEDIRLETIDDTEWVIGTGYIWKWYAQELVAKLNGQGGGLSEMPVSIETLIDEMHMDGDTEVFTKYQILGTTILGDSVAPAVADASIRALAAIGADAIHKMTLKVASANPQPDADTDTNDPSNSPVVSADANSLSAPKVNRKKKPYYMKGKISMNRLTELAAKFTGLSVLACNAENVLLSDENGTYISSYKVNDGEITTEEKKVVDATVSVGEGDDAVVFALSEIRANDSAKIADLEAKLASSEKEKADAIASLADMRKREHERRINAVKAAIKAKINELKDAECEVDEAECERLLEDESVEKFAEMEDDKGEFCGDAKACSEIEAIGCRAMLAAKKAEQSARANRYAWNMNARGEGTHSEYIDTVIANNAN